MKRGRQTENIDPAVRQFLDFIRQVQDEPSLSEWEKPFLAGYLEAWGGIPKRRERPSGTKKVGTMQAV